jgi:hypothetical protein
VLPSDFKVSPNPKQSKQRPNAPGSSPALAAYWLLHKIEWLLLLLRLPCPTVSGRIRKVGDLM